MNNLKVVHIDNNDMVKSSRSCDQAVALELFELAACEPDIEFDSGSF